MPTIEYDLEYTYPDDATGGIVLPVELSTTSSVRFPAHLDTGAAYCLFQSHWAELLGLTLSDGEPLKFSVADGGVLIAYGHSLNVRVLGMSVSSIVYFTDHPNFRRNVLGRQGWLHHFKLGLIHYDSQLYLSSPGDH